jgi:hypothetical protein
MHNGQYDAPVMVKVIGIFTFGATPGLKRHRLNALTAELSKIGLPMLWAIVASVTLPLASTETTQTPLPIIFRERASYGYSGRGELMARAFALEMDIIPVGRATVGALTGATLTLGGRFGGGVVSS